MYNNSRKKVRGLKRRCRSFSRFLCERTSSFPIDNNHKPSYVSAPLSQFFISIKRTPASVRKFYAQEFINRVNYLIDQKTDAEMEHRIFCVLSLPNLNLASIVKLYSERGLERFYEGLFYRNEETNMVVSLPPIHNDENEWGLYIPEGLQIKRYKIDASYPGQEVWLIGNLE